MAESPKHNTEAFGQQLESVYRTALLFAENQEQAERFVEEAFRRARVETDEETPGDPHSRLLRHLWEIRQEERTGTNEAPASMAEESLSAGGREAALEHARLSLTGVLRSLPSEDWARLVLHEIEGLSETAIAEITIESPERVAEHLQSTLAAIYDSVFGAVSPEVRTIITEDLPDDWIRLSLEAILQSVSSAPEGLRGRIMASTGPQLRRPQPVRQNAPSQTSESRSRRTGIRGRSLLTAVILIAVVGFGADVVYKRLARGPERNLIVLAARNVEAFSPDLETTSPDRAARFFRTHLGEQIPVPEITDAPLAAVGIEELTHEVRLPALRYSDQKTGRTITIYALTYRTLDQKSRWIELSSDVLRQIQSEIDFDLHDLGSGQVLIWRHRAHIFLAVSESDSDDLRARIYFASPDSK